MESPSLCWRDRIKAFLENRLFITAELLIAMMLQTLQTVRLISAALIYLFALGWLSLWLGKSGWRQLGLSRPTSWLRTVGIGAIVGLVYQAVSIWLVVPLLRQSTKEPLDLSQVTTAHNNVSLLILWLTVSWTWAAFGEEMVYRGYLLNRVTDLFGHSRAGWVIGLLGSSALFGIGHAGYVCSRRGCWSGSTSPCCMATKQLAAELNGLGMSNIGYYLRQREKRSLVHRSEGPKSGLAVSV